MYHEKHKNKQFFVNSKKRKVCLKSRERDADRERQRQREERKRI